MSYEKIFEYDLDIVGVIEYGASMEAVLAGQQSVPLQGAQFDVTLAGSIKGRMTGTIRGIDYLRVRADGRRELDLRATIDTEDGSRIAVSAQGSISLAVTSRAPAITAAMPTSPEPLAKYSTRAPRTISG